MTSADEAGICPHRMLKVLARNVTSEVLVQATGIIKVANLLLNILNT
jgi:hypothetical protein